MLMAEQALWIGLAGISGESVSERASLSRKSYGKPLMLFVSSGYFLTSKGARCSPDLPNIQSRIGGVVQSLNFCHALLVKMSKAVVSK